MKERKKGNFEEKMFGWNFLLSSCSLVRLYVNLQVKVKRKKMQIFKVFCGD